MADMPVYLTHNLHYHIKMINFTKYGSCENVKYVTILRTKSRKPHWDGFSGSDKEKARLPCCQNEGCESCNGGGDKFTLGSM